MDVTIGSAHTITARHPWSFGTYELMDHVVDTTEFEVEVSRSIQDHIMAFVKDPYHGPQKTFGWEPQVASDPNGDYLLRFGAKGKAAGFIDGVEVDGVCYGIGEYDPFP
ncbi:hypothetical protein EDB81DRAFT_881836 [Dactylonectria macrodidyma]|uniref:Uncharacterized protein n=1 Tax=Dactylonectria macrodidyma TaxID=307937 RepID=A0A9P9JBQ0_9HYPO|nr:hypothetical protein EDB81DRAFT_881836 [Dactylonectria macrodidyma]